MYIFTNSELQLSDYQGQGSTPTIEHDEENIHNFNDHIAGKKVYSRKIGSLVIAGIIAANTAMALPEIIDSKTTPLITNIAYSDISTATNEVLHMNPGSNEINADRFLSRFRLNNDLFKNSDLGWYASVWPSSMALEALFNTSLLKDSNNYLLDFKSSLAAISSSYWSNSIASQSGYDQGLKEFHSRSDPPLVDDNLWMGLINMGAYKKTHDANDLARAKSIFNLAASQWDVKNGGVYWMVQLESAANHIRAAVSNASVVKLGVELYLNSHKKYYLKESEKIFNWINNDLLDPSTGLYNDHISQLGYVDPIKYTYVQGIMLGAMMSLNQVDRVKYPISNAVDLAKKSIKYFSEHRSYGNPAFDAIWSQNLLQLASYYNNDDFLLSAKQSLKLALKASPKSPRGLLDAAGDVDLQSLSKLKPNNYKNIIY